LAYSRAVMLLLRACIAVATLSGMACSSKLPHPPYAAQPTSALTEVPFPPPPAHVEIVPARPASDADKAAVWLDGEWTWRNTKWSWKAGRWVIPPAGAAFSPWTSARGENGTCYFAPGTWRDAHGVTVTEPPPVAVAGAAAGVIFDADGDVEKTGKSRGGGGSGGRRDGGA
jgi:hypothetical protein